MPHSMPVATNFYRDIKIFGTDKSIGRDCVRAAVFGVYNRLAGTSTKDAPRERINKSDHLARITSAVEFRSLASFNEYLNLS